MQIPYFFQKHRARHDMTFIANQIFEDLEFTRQQFDISATAVRRSCHQVKFEIADAQHCFFDHCSTATSESLDTCQELGKSERLDQVIITAGAQAADAVVHFPESANNQRRGDDSCFPKTPNDSKAVDERKHAIDYDDGVLTGFAEA